MSYGKWFRLVIWLTLVIFTVVGCSRIPVAAPVATPTPVPPTPNSQTQRKIWDTQNIHSYRYAFTEECGLCNPMVPVIVEVREDAVVSVVDKNGANLTDWGQLYSEYYVDRTTVTKLFEYADKYLWLSEWSPTAQIHIEFDPQYGFPTMLCAGDADLIDSYGCTVISDFEVLE